MHSAKKKSSKKVLIIALAVAAVIIIAAVAAYFVWEQAPSIAGANPAPATEPPAEPAASAAPSATPEPTPTPVLDSAVAPENDRHDGVYTILLVGEDMWTGHTDTILVGKVDTNAHKMDFVSIPRDTLLNMDGDMRKINAVYANATSLDEDGMAALKSRVKDLIGFDVDCYAKIDLEAFVQVIDAVGGIDIYLDEPVQYDDVWQGMYIDVPTGQNHLSGQEAMTLVRYRAGYASADIGRIDVQHKFLTACVEQFISLGNIPNIGKVMDILTESVDTDLTAANIAYFIRQGLMCKTEDIKFYTMPTAPKNLGGYSYAVIILYDWVNMINDCLNPFVDEITTGNLNVMYNDYFGYGCTSEIQGGWYYVGAAEADRAAFAQAQGWG